MMDNILINDDYYPEPIDFESTNEFEAAAFRRGVLAERNKKSWAEIKADVKEIENKL